MASRKLALIALALASLSRADSVRAGDSSGKGAKEFKLGFITSLSGTFAAVGETQRKGVELAVEQVNAKGGLEMPWGKV